MGRAVLVVASLVLVMLAGCIDRGVDAPAATDAVPFDSVWHERALEYGADHDHENVGHHENRSTPNFEVIGWDPLVNGTYGTTPGGAHCGNVADVADDQRLAIVEARSKDVAFQLIDVTEPTTPRLLGELLMRTTWVYDMAVAPDGQHLVLVTAEPQAPDRTSDVLPSDYESGLAWRSHCSAGEVVPVAASEDYVPRPAAVLLVSIANPAAPQIVDHRVLAGLGHSVSVTNLDGRDWVVASVLGRTSLTNHHEFYEIAGGGPGGAHLELLSVYAPPPPDGDPMRYPLLLGHDDGWIAKHPGTNQTLAWLTNSHLGLFVLDMDDPREPRLVGRWMEWAPEREDYARNLHSIHVLPELWDGRHYIVVGPELGAQPVERPTGTIWVLDTTDPTQPREVAGWTLPHVVEWSDTYMFSPHYLAVHGRTAFVSMYHGGIWALDLAPVGRADFALLDAVGVFMPDRVSPAPPEEPMRWAPTSQEVDAFEDGTIFTFDSNSGIYALQFDADRPAPPPEPWPVEPLTWRRG